MNYILLDLEWDSNYSSKHKRFINYILQIGAVKLNEDLQYVDEFQLLINHNDFKSTSKRFVSLTGITNEDIKNGVPFNHAVDCYNEWAGQDENTVTMTWSDSDLYVILENEKCFLTGDIRFKIKNYLDLQKYIQNEIRSIGIKIVNQISLSTAAGILNIPTNSFSLHTAKDDCLLSAELLKRTYNSKRFEEMIRDSSSPEFMARLNFKTHYISDINDKAIRNKELKFNCEKCGNNTKRVGKWRYRNRWFSADFICNECGFKFNGRVSFKKTFEDVIVKRKICEYRPKNTGDNNDLQSVSERM